MVGIIDYGMGNLSSVQNALASLGSQSEVFGDPTSLSRFDRVILPGVGAFGQASANLLREGWVGPVRGWVAAGKPLLGICLGMQLFAERGLEFGDHKGLGLVQGVVDLMAPSGLAVPHMGWNSLRVVRPHPLLEGMQEGDDVYFVHSYAFQPGLLDAVAVCDYGGEFPAVVAKGSAFGCQFHPEKSQSPGLEILDRFLVWDGSWLSGI
jgi:imidazole glycerol-phosphate synthase subunit HisH